jgi:DNA-binding Xre family transcriptional regulator
MRMAERGMYATTDLVPLLAERGVVLSREQVYRLVAKVPERINLLTLAALCDALEVSPAELVEPVRAGAKPPSPKALAAREAVPGVRPRRARVARGE